MRPALTSERLSRAADITAKVFEVPQRELLSYLRIPAVTRARQAMYAAIYDACETSYPEMARRLGRDHTTLLWGIKRARAFAASDPEYAAALAQIIAVITYRREVIHNDY